MALHKFLRLSFALIAISSLMATPVFVVGSNSQESDSYSYGSILIEDNYNQKANIVYRSVEGVNSSITTLEPDYGNGIAPAHPYFAQSITINESTFYLSNTFAGFELFKDSNNNNYIDSKEEISYWVDVNATQNFEYSDITKTINSENITYQWTSNYNQIDGFLIPGSSFTDPGNPGTTTVYYPNFKTTQVEDSKVVISSFNLTYTVTDAENYTQLGIKYDIGSWDAYTFTFGTSGEEIRTGDTDLSNFGLSLVFTSLVRAEKNLSFIENSNQGIISDIKLTYENSVIFQSSFDESYTLDDNLEKLPSKTVVATNQTLLDRQKQKWELNYDFLEELNKNWDSKEIQELPAIPNDGIPIQNKFIYRISYPVWQSKIIHHDPIFRMNKVGVNFSPTIVPFTLPSIDALNFLFLSTFTGILAFSVIIIVERRKA
jgi:hypothetical protein